MEVTVRILLVLLVSLIAIGISIFVGRYFKLKITYWFGITVSLSISSLIFWTINQIIRPDMSDIFFLIYGLIVGIISLILLVKNNRQLQFWRK
tara:strand:+ start:430 stop:708 length:279 start_codon:yes stop_codon:yes gene_type:complete